MKTISLNKMLVFSLAVSAFLVWGGITSVGAAESGVLDGKVFVGDLVKKGEQTGDKDELIFKEGTFRSSACDARGFVAAPYTTESEGDAITFQAEASNDKGEKMAWNGTVKGETVEAKAVHTAKSGETMDFSLKGMLKE